MRKSKTTNEPGEPVDPALELQPTGGDLARGNTIILNPALHSAAATLTGTPSSASADGRSGATSVLFRKRTASKKPPALVLTKGQLISKCLLGVIVWTKKPTKFFSRISAIASKKRSNQKSSVRD